MSSYTTGEIAKLCNVTVRTVQYYDSRDILVPSDFSEGGRRLYTQEDVQKLKVICFLRNIGLSINGIAEILHAPNADKVIHTLLEEQERSIRNELSEKEEQLRRIISLKKEVKNCQELSVQNLNNIAYFMENKKGLRKVRIVMVVCGLLIDAIEVGTLLLWIFAGIWIPFAAGMLIVAAGAAWLMRYYYRRVLYVCPECHARFKPDFREFFFSKHTSKTRKLTCKVCGYHGFTVETYGKEEDAAGDGKGREKQERS